MLAFNPLLLLYDVSFQLSFLSSLGIIYLFSIFNKLLKFIPQNLLGAREILATTFSAYIFSLPILAYNFGSVSLISPVSNILILPMVPWLMAFGFIFSLVGVFIPFLGWILSFIPYFLLSYLVFIVEILSKPWFSQTIKDISWLWLLFLYFVLVPISHYFYRKEKNWFIGT